MLTDLLVPNQLRKIVKNVKVLSYNVRLFNNYNWINIKSDSIYNYLKNEKVDIVCLQEFIDLTHEKNKFNYKQKYTTTVVKMDI